MPDDEPDGDELLTEPLSMITAQSVAHRILSSGNYAFTRHALERLAEREMSQGDVINTIRAGRCVLVTFECGTYRYQFETNRGFHAVIAFRSASELVLITAWKSS